MGHAPTAAERERPSSCFSNEIKKPLISLVFVMLKGESLREWAAVRVEMGACLERPEVRARLRQWADELVRSLK
jgi:hypothetical protein